MHLEAGAHLAPPLEDVLDEVLAPPPHLVALLHEVLAEPHPVGAVRAEGRGLKPGRLKTIIYHTVSRLRSFLTSSHSIIPSFRQLVNFSFGHLVIW